MGLVGAARGRERGGCALGSRIGARGVRARRRRPLQRHVARTRHVRRVSRGTRSRRRLLGGGWHGAGRRRARARARWLRTRLAHRRARCARSAAAAAATSRSGASDGAARVEGDARGAGLRSGAVAAVVLGCGPPDFLRGIRCSRAYGTLRNAGLGSRLADVATRARRGTLRLRRRRRRLWGLSGGVALTAAAGRRLVRDRPAPHASSERYGCALGSWWARLICALGGGRGCDDSLALGVGAVDSVV